MSAKLLLLLCAMLASALDRPVQGERSEEDKCKLDDTKDGDTMRCDCWGIRQNRVLEFWKMEWRNLHIKNCRGADVHLDPKEYTGKDESGREYFEMYAIEVEDVRTFNIYGRNSYENGIRNTAIHIRRIIVRNFRRQVALFRKSFENVTVGDLKIENGNLLRIYTSALYSGEFGEFNLRDIRNIRWYQDPTFEMNVVRKLEMVNVSINPAGARSCLIVAKRADARFAMKERTISQGKWPSSQSAQYTSVQGFHEVTFQDCTFRREAGGKPSTVSFNFTDDFRVTFDRCTFQNMPRGSLVGRNVSEVNFVNNTIQDMDSLNTDVEVQKIEDGKYEVNGRYFGTLFDVARRVDLEGNRWKRTPQDAVDLVIPRPSMDSKEISELKDALESHSNNTEATNSELTKFTKQVNELKDSVISLSNNSDATNSRLSKLSEEVGVLKETVSRGKR